MKNNLSKYQPAFKAVENIEIYDFPEYWENNGRYYKMDEWVDVDHAAHLLGLSPETIKNVRYKRIFKHVRYDSHTKRRLWLVKELYAVWQQSVIISFHRPNVKVLYNHDITTKNKKIRFQTFQLDNEYGIRIFVNHDLIDVIEDLSKEDIMKMCVDTWHALKNSP